MLWPILLKTYAAATVIYLAVTAGYLIWRFRLRKKSPTSSMGESGFPSQQ